MGGRSQRETRPEGVAAICESPGYDERDLGSYSEGERTNYWKHLEQKSSGLHLIGSVQVLYGKLSVVNGEVQPPEDPCGHGLSVRAEGGTDSIAGREEGSRLPGSPALAAL